MENWITVMSFSFTHEAHMAKGFLESAGIETELKDEMAAQLQELAVAVGCFDCEKEWKYKKQQGSGQPVG